MTKSQIRFKQGYDFPGPLYVKELYFAEEYFEEDFYELQIQLDDQLAYTIALAISHPW